MGEPSQFTNVASFGHQTSIGPVNRRLEHRTSFIQSSCAHNHPPVLLDSRHFWKNIKQMTNKKVKLPTNIDGVHGDNDIVSMWKQHYATIFNSVENSSCDQAHSDFFNTNIAFDNGMTVDLFEMKAVIDDLACNKSPGLDGLSSEHFKFAHSRLPALLSTLVTSIVVHGHVPESMNESVSAYH